MASPLILRIAVQSDTAPLDATNQKLRSFQDELRKAATAANLSKDKLKVLSQGLKEVQDAFDKTDKGGGKSTENLSKDIRGLVQQFIIFRRVATIFSIFAAPILLAEKSLVALDAVLKPLNASLAQIGTTSRSESAALVGFVEKLTAGTSTSLKDGIVSLTAYVNKTKSTVDVEKNLAAAHTLALATGMKLPDATNAITDALNGESAALAQVTLKSKEQINSLVRNGQLADVITKNYKDAADAAQTGSFEFWKKVGKGATDATTSFASHVFGRDALLQQQQLLESINSVGNFKKAMQDLGESKISFTTLDDFRTAIGKVESALSAASKVVASGVGTTEQVHQAQALIPVYNKIITLLQQQQQIEMQLPATERYRLSTTALVVGLQADLFAEQNRSLTTINESNDSLEKQKSIRAELVRAQEAQIHAESIQQVRQITSQGKGITEEQKLSIATQEAAKLNQLHEAAYKNENEINLKVLDSDNKLQKARLDLQKFYLENRLRQYSGTTAEQAYRVENQFVEKEAQFAIEASKREAMQLLSDHRLTATEEARIETELQLKLTQIRQSAEDTRAKETQARLGRLSQPEQARVTQLVSQLDKNGGRGLWTDQAELEKYKKISDEKVAVAKSEQEALVRYFGEETRVTAEKATIPGDVIGTLQEMVKKMRVAAKGGEDIKALTDEFTKAFTPDEKELLTKYDALLNGLQAHADQKKVKIGLDVESHVDISAVASRIVTEVQRQLMGVKAASVYKEGVEQGGSES